MSTETDVKYIHKYNHVLLYDYNILISIICILCVEVGINMLIILCSLIIAIMLPKMISYILGIKILNS
jgi:hypothetical protein